MDSNTRLMTSTFFTTRNLPETSADVRARWTHPRVAGWCDLDPIWPDTVLSGLAWARGQKVTVHGWVYGLRDGLLKDLKVSMDHPDSVVDAFRTAIKRYPREIDRDTNSEIDTTFDSLDDD